MNRQNHLVTGVIQPGQQVGFVGKFCEFIDLTE